MIIRLDKVKSYDHSNRCMTSREVAEEMKKDYKDSSREIFFAVFMDAKNAIVEKEIVSIGTVDMCPVYPREVIKSALTNNASSVLFVHNHPSGDTAPSQGDRDITKTLVLACHIMDITVLDHIILGNGYYSFADSGLIAEYVATATSISKEHNLT